MGARLGFSIKNYATVQVFRSIGPTKLLLWPFENHHMPQELYGVPMLIEIWGKLFPPDLFYIEKPHKTQGK